LNKAVAGRGADIPCRAEALLSQWDDELEKRRQTGLSGRQEQIPRTGRFHLKGLARVPSKEVHREKWLIFADGDISSLQGEWWTGIKGHEGRNCSSKPVLA
jgi:hypothetical protein